MSNRITSFLATTHCAGWQRLPVAGDASSRRYERLHSGTGETAILMDAHASPPDELNRFILIAAALRSAGLSAPEIHNSNPESGLILMEDLGAADIAAALSRDPALATDCYTAAIEILFRMPEVQALPLGQLDAKNAALWLAPLGTWYGPEKIDISTIQDEMSKAFMGLGMIADTLALRDYHAENLIWREGKTGLTRVGLLDFQDAIYAPSGYDLASLTRDARRDVDPNTANMLTQKFADSMQIDLEEFNAQVACLAVQRNLRILGIFASLSKRDGKTSYAAFVPRVWRYLIQDLSHPALAELQRAILAVVQEPKPDFLSRWTQ